MSECKGCGNERHCFECKHYPKVNEYGKCEEVGVNIKPYADKKRCHAKNCRYFEKVKPLTCKGCGRLKYAGTGNEKRCTYQDVLVYEKWTACKEHTSVVKRECKDCRFSYQNNPIGKECSTYRESLGVYKKWCGVPNHTEWEAIIDKPTSLTPEKVEVEIKKSCNECKFSIKNNPMKDACTSYRRKLGIYKKCDNDSEWKPILKEPVKKEIKDEERCKACKFSFLNNKDHSNCVDYRISLGVYKDCNGWSEWEAIVEVEKSCKDCKYWNMDPYKSCKSLREEAGTYKRECNDHSEWESIEKPLKCSDGCICFKRDYKYYSNWYGCNKEAKLFCTRHDMKLKREAIGCTRHSRVLTVEKELKSCKDCNHYGGNSGCVGIFGNSPCHNHSQWMADEKEKPTEYPHYDAYLETIKKTEAQKACDEQMKLQQEMLKNEQELYKLQTDLLQDQLKQIQEKTKCSARTVHRALNKIKEEKEVDKEMKEECKHEWNTITDYLSECIHCGKERKSCIFCIHYYGGGTQFDGCSPPVKCKKQSQWEYSPVETIATRNYYRARLEEKKEVDKKMIDSEGNLLTPRKEVSEMEDIKQKTESIKEKTERLRRERAKIVKKRGERIWNAFSHVNTFNLDYKEKLPKAFLRTIKNRKIQKILKKYKAKRTLREKIAKDKDKWNEFLPALEYVEENKKYYFLKKAEDKYNEEVSKSPKKEEANYFLPSEDVFSTKKEEPTKKEVKVKAKVNKQKLRINRQKGEIKELTRKVKDQENEIDACKSVMDYYATVIKTDSKPIFTPKRYCESCGKDIKREAYFCSQCGGKVK